MRALAVSVGTRAFPELTGFALLVDSENPVVGAVILAFALELGVLLAFGFDSLREPSQPQALAAVSCVVIVGFVVVSLPLVCAGVGMLVIPAGWAMTLKARRSDSKQA